jgi:hypothetical protein
MQSSFLMTVKLSGRFPIFSGLFQSLVAFHANPLPAGNALIVVKKSQTIPLHLWSKPTCLSRQTEHSLSPDDTFSIFDGSRAAALCEQDRIFHGGVSFNWLTGRMRRQLIFIPVLRT